MNITFKTKKESLQFEETARKRRQSKKNVFKTQTNLIIADKLYQ